MLKYSMKPDLYAVTLIDDDIGFYRPRLLHSIFIYSEFIDITVIRNEIQ